MKKINFNFNLKSLFAIIFNSKKNVAESRHNNESYNPPFSEDGNHFLGGWFGESL